jgi:hypothetical protein
MTANEMYNTFQLLYNAATSIEMGFDQNEVSAFHTLAQNDIVISYLFENRNPVQESYEIGKKRDEDFRNLKSFAQISEFEKSNKYDNSYLVTLPIDFLYNSSEEAVIKINNVEKRVKIKPENEDEILEILKNPFRQPDRNSVLRITNSNNSNILILGENAEIVKYNLSYIRTPKPIVIDLFDENNQVNCELSNELHQHIVRRAVTIATQSTNSSERYQISLNEERNNN